MTSQPKDGWDIASVIASIIGFILIPLVIAVSAWYLESSLRESELAAQEYENERNREAQRAASDRDARLRTFEVAVGILQQDPESNRNEISALRRWAIKIFVDFSAENVPEGVKNQDFHFGPGTATVYTRVAPNTTSFRAEPCTSPPPIGARARPSAHRRWLSGLNGAPADTAPAKPFWSQKLLILARATLPTGHRQRPDPPQHVAKQPPVQMSLRQ